MIYVLYIYHTISNHVSTLIPFPLLPFFSFNLCASHRQSFSASTIFPRYPINRVNRTESSSEVPWIHHDINIFNTKIQKKNPVRVYRCVWANVCMWVRVCENALSLAFKKSWVLWCDVTPLYMSYIPWRPFDFLSLSIHLVFPFIFLFNHRFLNVMTFSLEIRQFAWFPALDRAQKKPTLFFPSNIWIRLSIQNLCSHALIIATSL